MENKEHKPNKPISEMTPEELREFRNSVDPDSMGFDGKVEGARDENK